MIDDQLNVKKVMTEANLIDFENRKLKYARKWCYVQAVIAILIFAQTLVRKDVIYSTWLLVV